MIKLIKKGGLLAVSFILSIFGAVGAVDLTDNANAESISKKSNKTITVASVNDKNNLQDTVHKKTKVVYEYTKDLDEQGMTSYKDKLYSIRINGDDYAQVIRVDQNGTNGKVLTTNGKDSVNYLYHANDISAVEINGNVHLFVATADSRGESPHYQIVELEIKGDTFTKVRELYPQNANTPLNATGIHVVSDGGSLHFFMKSAAMVYKQDVKITDLRDKYKIKGESFFAPGVKLEPGQSSAVNQPGFGWLAGKSGTDYNYQGFYMSSNLLYVVIGGGKAYQDKSVILTFELSGNIDKNNEIYYLGGIESKYGKVEFEAVTFIGDTIFVNTNIGDATNEAQADAILTYTD